MASSKLLLFLLATYFTLRRPAVTAFICVQQLNVRSRLSGRDRGLLPLAARRYWNEPELLVGVSNERLQNLKEHYGDTEDAPAFNAMADYDKLDPICSEALAEVSDKGSLFYLAHALHELHVAWGDFDARQEFETPAFYGSLSQLEAVIVAEMTLMKAFGKEKYYLPDCRTRCYAPLLTSIVGLEALPQYLLSGIDEEGTGFTQLPKESNMPRVGVFLRRELVLRMSGEFHEGPIEPIFHSEFNTLGGEALRNVQECEFLLGGARTGLIKKVVVGTALNVLYMVKERRIGLDRATSILEIFADGIGKAGGGGIPPADVPEVHLYGSLESGWFRRSLVPDTAVNSELGLTIPRVRDFIHVLERSEGVEGERCRDVARHTILVPAGGLAKELKMSSETNAVDISKVDSRYWGNKKTIAVQTSTFLFANAFEKAVAERGQMTYSGNIALSDTPENKWLFGQGTADLEKGLRSILEGEDHAYVTTDKQSLVYTLEGRLWHCDVTEAEEERGLALFKRMRSDSDPIHTLQQYKKSIGRIFPKGFA